MPVLCTRMLTRDTGSAMLMRGKWPTSAGRSVGRNEFPRRWLGHADARQVSDVAPSAQHLAVSLWLTGRLRPPFPWHATEKPFRRGTSYKFGVRRQRRRFGFLSISASKDPKRRRRYVLPAHSKFVFQQPARRSETASNSNAVRRQVENPPRIGMAEPFGVDFVPPGLTNPIPAA
jgi:hypothetical protein